MRADQRHEQHPRLRGCGGSVRLQPIDRRGGDAVVVILVARIAAPGVDGEPQRGLPDRQRVAQPAERVANAVDDMQRHDLLGEAVVVTGAAEVQLADRHRCVTGFLEPVPPRRHAAVIGDRIVPEADLVDMAAGRQRGARRHADRRIGVGVGEAHATRRQPVEVRRLDHRVAITAEHPPAVLVRQDEQKVRGFHRRLSGQVTTRR